MDRINKMSFHNDQKMNLILKDNEDLKSTLAMIGHKTDELDHKIEKTVTEEKPRIDSVI